LSLAIFVTTQQKRQMASDLEGRKREEQEAERRIYFQKEKK
jgi:hypothetical protein